MPLFVLINPPKPACDAPDTPFEVYKLIKMIVGYCGMGRTNLRLVNSQILDVWNDYLEEKHAATSTYLVLRQHNPFLRDLFIVHPDKTIALNPKCFSVLMRTSSYNIEAQDEEITQDLSKEDIPNVFIDSSNLTRVDELNLVTVSAYTARDHNLKKMITWDQGGYKAVPVNFFINAYLFRSGLDKKFKGLNSLSHSDSDRKLLFKRIRNFFRNIESLDIEPLDLTSFNDPIEMSNTNQFNFPLNYLLTVFIYLVLGRLGYIIFNLGEKYCRAVDNSINNGKNNAEIFRLSIILFSYAIFLIIKAYTEDIRFIPADWPSKKDYKETLLFLAEPTNEKLAAKAAALAANKLEPLSPIKQKQKSSFDIRYFGLERNKSSNINPTEQEVRSGCFVQ